jgi:hypothetical protein
LAMHGSSFHKEMLGVKAIQSGPWESTGKPGHPRHVA